MKIHRGQILKKAIDQSGVSLLKISKAAKISRQTLYKIMEMPDAGIDYILKVGVVIHHDFSEEIPELKPKKLSKEEEDNLTYKIKYFELLEKHLAVLERQEEYETKNKKKKS